MFLKSVNGKLSEINLLVDFDDLGDRSNLNAKAKKVDTCARVKILLVELNSNHNTPKQ